ncbi:DNA/RNA non-specific endonuclease [Nocardiopsis sp. FR26]|uniref:DNA/RNA non-specific endonuclease n=1 Tax=Nocardiopsis sp. FR26 TaxID=2605987 RepID=UPI0013588860|nr:DNA/RNA non-specific endonuclease [Nocardiopsis sp. FR26]
MPPAGHPPSSGPLSTFQQVEMLTNSEGKVSPSTFPVPNASPDYIEGLAADLRTAGESVADTGNDINGSWSGLTNCYKAPEAAELYTVLAPVASNGDDVSTGMGQAATALETFAADLRSIKSRWSTLRAEAYEFRARIDAEGEDWRKGDGWFGFGDSANVEENDRLIERGQNLIEEYEEAERVCANGVNKFVPDRTRFEAAPKGDGALDPGVFYHGYEQDLSDLATEWELGGAEMDANWVVDVGSAVWDFGVDAVEGTGAMLGMHSSEGWFQASWGDALWEYHEGNVQSALSMVGMYDAESDSYGWAGWDSVGSAWKDAAHAVVPWEEWGDRPGYVIGTALLNIGATVGGALLTATGVGAVVGVPLMAWRGMAMLDSMGGGRGGSGGGSGIDVDVPQNFPAFGGQGSPVINIDTSRFSGSGALSAQLTDANSALNWLLASTGESSTSTGGDNPRTQNTSGEQAPRVSSPNRDKEKENVSRKAGTDPTAQQLKDTEDLLSQLGPADVAELQRTERDVLAEGGSRGSESSGSRQAEEAGLDPSLDSVFAEGRALASDYPAWEMGPLRDGPEGDRVPAHVGGGNPDTLTAARDVPSSSSPSRLDLTDIGGDRFPDTPDTHRDTGSHDRGPEMRDDSPAVRNSADDSPGTDPVSGENGSQRPTEVSDRPRQDTTAERTRVTGELPERPGRHDDADPPTGDRNADTDGPARRSGSGDSGNGSSSDGSGNGESSDPWNNDSLDDRYRPPVVPEENRTTIEPGTRASRNGPGYPGPNSVFAPKGGLKANWMYELPGRGKFYTDGEGKVSYIDTHAGEKGDRNPELRKPRPNVTYAVDVLENKGKKYFYETDSHSRTAHAHGELQRIKSDAENGGLSLEEKNEIYRADDQGQEGRKGNRVYKGDEEYHKTDWDGGHFIGTGFGGSGHRLNLYAQLRELNQQITGGTPETNFFALEREWRAALDAGQAVRVDFEADYGDRGEVPTAIKVKYWIDGEPQEPITYHNQPDVKRGSASARSYAERVAATALGAALLMGIGEYDVYDEQANPYAGLGGSEQASSVASETRNQETSHPS